MAYTTNAALTAFPSAYSRTRTSTGVHQLGERAGTHWPFSPLVIPSKKLPGELAQVRRKAILRPKLKILVAKVITNRHLADHPMLQQLRLCSLKSGNMFVSAWPGWCRIPLLIALMRMIVKMRLERREASI